MDKIVDIFRLTYRTTTKSTLPLQRCPAGLFGPKPRTTLDFLPTKHPTGRDLKIQRQFSDRNGAVARNFDGADPIYVRYRRSHDWKEGSVAKRISGRLYVTLAN